MRIHSTLVARLVALFLVGAAADAGAQNGLALGDSGAARASGGRRVATAVRVTAPPKVDGRLDDAVWSSAPRVSTFTQRDPREGEPASEATEVRIVYDDEAVYVGARMQDRGRITTRLGRRDMSLAGSDWVRLSLDSYMDRQTAFHFDVNPEGVRRDAYLSAEGTRTSWDAVWEAATSIDGEGWTAELRIPFSQLRFGPAVEQVWGIQIERRIDRLQESAVFAFTTKAEAGGIAAFGELVGLRDLRRGRALELVPYASAKSEMIDPGPNPYRRGIEQSLAAGLDARLRVTSDLTVSATFNPDFGQVEVDPSVINLTAFETFFDEKRPFFVEGAGSFDFGGGPGGPWPAPTLFYSRRIGRRPQLSVATRASDAPDATTILGAAKLTGRTSGGWSVGILDAVTQAEFTRYRDDSGGDAEALVEPSTNYFVGRVRRELRKGRSGFGGIVTATHRNVSTPATESLLRSAAYAAGVDFLHEADDRRWAVSGYLSGSRIAGSASAIELAQRSAVRYFARPDADHLELDADATSLQGYAAQLRFRRQAGEHVRADIAASAYSPGYEVNDLGFQARADRVGAGGSLSYTETKPGDVLRNWTVSAMANFGANYGGDWIDQWVNASVTMTALNYWYLVLGAGNNFERPDDRLTRGGPLAIAPRRFDFGMLLGSDPRRSLSGSVRLRQERDAAGGVESQVGVEAVLRPSPRWSFSLGPQFLHDERVAQYVARVNDATATSTYGSRYVFAPLAYTELAVETRLNVNFTPDLTLELFAQPFLSSGAFGTPAEFQPGSIHLREFARADRVEVDGAPVYEVEPDGDAGAAPAFRVRDGDFTSHALRGNAVLRWEWRPGSTLFLVWQQGRSYNDGSGRFGGRDRLLRADSDNVFVIKATYWLNPNL